MFFPALRLSRLFVVAACATAFAFTRSDAVDLSRELTVNRLGTKLTNVGYTGFLVPGAPGLEYPRGLNKYVFYAGGLWVGAKVNGQVNTAQAEYGTDFNPGTWSPPDDLDRVFFVTRDDTIGSGQWMAQAVPRGAPTNADGTTPLYLGDQTTYAAYRSSTLEPPAFGWMNLDVHQTTWASNDDAIANDVVFVRYVIFNRGFQTLTEFRVGFWADADIGDGRDDCVGSEPAFDLAYAYNGQFSDAIYGVPVPAVGVMLFQGIKPFPDAAPLRVTELNAWKDGDDPLDAQAHMNLLAGLQAAGGPWIDPGNGQPTTFVYTGDPVAGTGWRDPTALDKRLLVSTGPATMAVGDSQVVVFAILAAQGSDRLQSVRQLKDRAANLRGLVGLDPFPGSKPAGPGLALAPFMNPVRGRQTIRLQAPRGRAWQLDLFGVSGRRVGRLAENTGTGSSQAAEWNSAALGLSRGVYWLVLTSDEGRVARSVVVLGP